MTTNSSSIKGVLERFVGFNGRGIVDYWEAHQFAKCNNCGQEVHGVKAKEWMFGHVGCPKPNGEYLRNDFTPQDLKDAFTKTYSQGVSDTEERVREEIVRLKKSQLDNYWSNSTSRQIYAEGFIKVLDELFNSLHK